MGCTEDNGSVSRAGAGLGELDFHGGDAFAQLRAGIQAVCAQGRHKPVRPKLCINWKTDFFGDDLCFGNGDGVFFCAGKSDRIQDARQQRRVKRISPVKRFLSFYGDRSMDYLTIHFFSGYLIAYIGGFWYDFLTQSIPEDNPAINRLHFAILIIAILPLTYVQVRLNDLYRLKRKSHKSQSLNKEP